jgi:hypothetical protein
MGKLREDAIVKCTKTVPINTFTAQETAHNASQHLNIRNIKPQKYIIKTTNITQDQPYCLYQKGLLNSQKMKQNMSARNKTQQRISQ